MSDDYEERALRQQDLAEFYSRVASTYAEKGPPFFSHAGRRLVELAEVEPGDAVLDVATGRGAVLIPAGRRVGRSGHAVGIDIAQGMVEHARRSIALEDLTQATVQQMDAAHLIFAPESFTHGLSSFAVFFFPNVAEVLSECWRVLRPNGLVGFAFSRGEDPRWTWYEELLRTCGALDNLPPTTGEPSVRQRGALVAALKQAHFVDVDEIEEATELFYTSPEDWWASLWTHGSRQPLERLQADVLARIQTRCLAQARALVSSRGVPQLMSFVYVVGRKSRGA